MTLTQIRKLNGLKFVSWHLDLTNMPYDLRFLPCAHIAGYAIACSLPFFIVIPYSLMINNHSSQLVQNKVSTIFDTWILSEEPSIITDHREYIIPRGQG